MHAGAASDQAREGDISRALRNRGLGKGSSVEERYFKLPYEYWTAEPRWYRTLPFRAKATLLVALSLPAGFVLPTDRVPD
jgi:hypothetical protein